MPLKVDSILSYVNGNKYKSILETKINYNNLKKFSEFLITKKNQRNKLVFI